jgi:acyl-lipid omega-6 desaturase (Delta-12 desaturase)
MTKNLPPQEPLPSMADINRMLAPYQKADTRHSILQLANTLVPYVVLWVLMVISFNYSYWLTLLLAIPASLFMVRIFIFFHDCGHNSFFPSKKWNKLVGFWLGVLVFTPGEHWWHSHAIHHATSGNLDKRGTGDVETLTQDEYLQAKWSKRFGYRFFRNPLVMFGLGPIFMFLIMHRLAVPSYGKKEDRSVLLTNIAILAVAGVISYFIGFYHYLLIQLPLIWMGGGIGIWLFYVQHQFEETYWERDPDWNYVASALLGASFYKLPSVFQWFSGNIGYHHIHHLSPRIPNYLLEKAHNNSPLIQRWARKIEWGAGWKTTRLKAWHELEKKMADFPRRMKLMNHQ